MRWTVSAVAGESLSATRCPASSPSLTHPELGLLSTYGGGTVLESERRSTPKRLMAVLTRRSCAACSTAVTGHRPLAVERWRLECLSGLMYEACTITQAVRGQERKKRLISDDARCEMDGRRGGKAWVRTCTEGSGRVPSCPVLSCSVLEQYRFSPVQPSPAPESPLPSLERVDSSRRSSYE